MLLFNKVIGIYHKTSMRNLRLVLNVVFLFCFYKLATVPSHPRVGQRAPDVHSCLLWSAVETTEWHHHHRANRSDPKPHLNWETWQLKYLLLYWIICEKDHMWKMNNVQYVVALWCCPPWMLQNNNSWICTGAGSHISDNKNYLQRNRNAWVSLYQQR